MAVRVAVAYNPIAGRGRGADLARDVTAALRNAGHSVEPIERGAGSSATQVSDAVGSADFLVIVGGDGSVNALAGVAHQTRTPIYQVPTGTENLFAREFGMERDLRTLVGALQSPRVAPIDMGLCDLRPFLLMCSVGFDANVVHRLARERRGPISHRSYARHVFHELARPAFPPISVFVDGQRVVDERSGLVVVANSRQYALRLDPATRADMTDARLDVVFAPFNSRLRLIAWALGMRAGVHLRDPELIYETGSEIRIERAAVPFQIDGDGSGEIWESGVTPKPIQISVIPAGINVLLPVASVFRSRGVGSACSGAG